MTGKVNEIKARLEAIEKELAVSYARWEELVAVKYRAERKCRISYSMSRLNARLKSRPERPASFEPLG